MGAWTQSITNQSKADQSKKLTETQQKGVADLYKDMAELAPQTQMFMVGCSQELEDKFQRIACRQLVMRNILAMSAGIHRTLFWDFWHDRRNPNDLMQLMFGKQVLTDMVDGQFKPKKPITDTFRLLADALDGMKQVKKVDVPGKESIFLFEVERNGRSPLFVVWERRDSFKGEDLPAVPFAWPWEGGSPKAVDALGKKVEIEVNDGKLQMMVSVTPILFESGK
jgi:hypothetical protein